MAEWPAEQASERYAKYLAGSLPPDRNEIVQLGFRLAKAAGIKHFFGIDVDGDFPYGAVTSFAQTHGQSGLLEGANKEIETFIQTQTETLRSKGIVATLLSERSRTSQPTTTTFIDRCSTLVRVPSSRAWIC